MTLRPGQLAVKQWLSPSRGITGSTGGPSRIVAVPGWLARHDALYDRPVADHTITATGPADPILERPAMLDDECRHGVPAVACICCLVKVAVVAAPKVRTRRTRKLRPGRGRDNTIGWAIVAEDYSPVSTEVDDDSSSDFGTEDY